MPPTFDSFCSTIGIFVVVGNASSLYYNTTLCIVMAISVRNTLKKSLLSPIKYHGVTIFIVVIATLTIILTQNFGEGFTGLCGYKLASK